MSKNTNVYRFSLHRYNQGDKRLNALECPRCGDFSLVPYVDNYTGEMIGKECGRCNHEKECGYHLRPGEFLKTHPEISKKLDEAKNNSLNDFMNNYPEIVRKAKIIKAEKRVVDEIPFSIVSRFEDDVENCDLFLFLNNYTKFTGKEIKEIFKEYHIGKYRNGETLFWDIDIDGKVRTGKAMKYDKETGHRVKNDKYAIFVIHGDLKKYYGLDQDFQGHECLFGAHLLKKYPTKKVAVVESEKTALLCSLAYPDFVWVATSGKEKLKKLSVLQGRDVVLFPDLDGYKDWNDWRIAYENNPDYRFGSLKISTDLKNIAMHIDMDEHSDLADYLLLFQK